MRTRFCVQCTEHKTIQGLWYLLPPNHAAAKAASPMHHETGSMFICETCYRVPAHGLGPQMPTPAGGGIGQARGDLAWP